MKVSKTGYKKNSKDKNEPALVIPSNKITMKGVDFPVFGVSDTGDAQMMYPGLEYSFGGNYVYELPMAKDGYILPGRFRNPEGNWVSKYASGGDISIPDLSRPNWLDKYQPGGGVIDPLYGELSKEEADSLILHNAYQHSLKNNIKGYQQWLNDMGSIYPGGPAELRKVREKNMGVKYGQKINNDKKSRYKKPAEEVNFDPAYSEDNKVIDYYKSLVGTDPNFRIGRYSSPDLWHKTIMPIGMFYDGSETPIYKKPSFVKDDKPTEKPVYQSRLPIPENIKSKEVVLQAPEDRLVREYNTLVPNEDYRRVYDKSPYSVKNYGPDGQLTHWAKEDEKIPGVWRPIKGTPSDLLVSKRVKFNTGGWLDKAQNGQQVKYYDDLKKFNKANQLYNDSLIVHNAFDGDIQNLKNANTFDEWTTSHLNHLKGTTSSNTPKLHNALVNLYSANNGNFGPSNTYLKPFPGANDTGYAQEYIKPRQQPKLDQQAVMQQISKDYPGYSVKFDKNKILIRKPETEEMIDRGEHNLWEPLPTQKKKDKPKEYIPTKTPKLEREPLPLVMPQSDRTLMPYNNTLQVLRSIQKEDRSNKNLYPTRIVPAPTFRHGGWLEGYQEGSEVTQIGPELNTVNVSAEKPNAIKRAWNNFERSKYNPMNLFLEDMTSLSGEESAFDTARNMGMPEYMYKGKRYSTKMDWLTPQEQLEQTGITDDQLHRRGFFEKRLSNNLDPIGYGMGDQSQFDRFWNAAIKNEKDPNKAIRDLGIEDPDAGPVYSNNRTDAYNLYTGLPQKYNTFSISKYKPSRAKDSDVIYYSINDLANDKDFKTHVVDVYNVYKANIDDIVKQRNLSDDKLDYLKKRYDIGSDRARINEGLNPGEGLNDQNLGYIFNKAFYNDSDLSRNDTEKLKAFLKDIGEIDLANNINSVIQESRKQGSSSPYSSQITDISNIISTLTDYDPKTKSYGFTDYAAGVMGNYNLSKGVDPETGREYLSYRDKWDIDPVDFGKPFEIYDRIYLDDPDLIESQLLWEVPQQKYGGSKKWLDKYQDAGQVKTYTSDPNYFNNRAVFVDNPQANDLVRSKIYAGTHGWDPSSNSLVKLDKPVAVPEAVQEMSTADWGKKSSKQRFESDTPAGKATRKAVAAREMEQAVTNPYFRGAIPAMLAAPAIAAAGPSVLSALNAPAVLGSTTLPGVTAGNALGAIGAADALINRFPQVPGQLSRGEYKDAAINALTGGLDLYGANMVSPLYKGAKAAGKYIQSVNPLENSAAAVNSRTFNKNYDPLFKFHDRYGYVPDYTVGKPAKDFEFADKNIYRNIHPSDLQTANELGYVITPSEKALGLDAALTNANAERLIKMYNSPSGSMGLIPGQAGKIDGYHPFFMEGNKLFDTKNIPRPLLRFNPEKAPDVNINDSFLGAENFSFHPKANTNYRIAVPDKNTRRMSNYDQLQWDSELKTYVPIQQKSDEDVVSGLLKAGNDKEVSKVLNTKSVSRGPGPMMLGLPNYTHEVKNVDYFKKMLDSYSSNKLSSQSKKYFEGIINSVRKQEGLATKKQYDMLQRLRTGDFNYGKKEYGGIKSSGEGYYDYINGYSGIFANGGSKGWLDNYK